MADSGDSSAPRDLTDRFDGTGKLGGDRHLPHDSPGKKRGNRCGIGNQQDRRIVGAAVCGRNVGALEVGSENARADAHRGGDIVELI